MLPFSLEISFHFLFWTHQGLGSQLCSSNIAAQKASLRFQLSEKEKDMSGFPGDTGEYKSTGRTADPQGKMQNKHAGSLFKKD